MEFSCHFDEGEIFNTIRFLTSIRFTQNDELSYFLPHKYHRIIIV